MAEVFVNKVAESGILTLDLADYYPKDEIAVFDMKDFLFMGLILREKDFREALKNLELQPFTAKIVAVTCSADAIIPMWAYMLAAAYLEPVARGVYFGNEQQVAAMVLEERIRKVDRNEFLDQRVVVKGCGDLPIGENAYLAITQLLRPVAKSIMYGEPCSTVPIFKKKV
jgi:hypothetical protein